jgi:hypothetical protein
LEKETFWEWGEILCRYTTPKTGVCELLKSVLG